MATNPMNQFEVYRIGPEIKLGAIDISFTNASLFMVISSLAILLIFNLGSKKNSLLPSKMQLLSELSYTFVSKMISDTAGSKAKPYFAFIFSIFMFVLFCNMFGMIPYAFTVTSHIIVTFILASFIFVGVTIIGFMKHGLGYLKLFVPSGVPMDKFLNDHTNQADALASIAESLSAISTSANFIMVLMAALVILKGLKELHKYINL